MLSNSNLPSFGKLHKNGQIIKVMGLKENEIAYNPYPLGIIDKEGYPIFAVRQEDRLSDWVNVINHPNNYDPKVHGPYNPSIRFYIEKPINEEEVAFYPIKGAPVMEGMEDPFCTKLIDNNGNQKLLFGGVRVDFKNPKGPIAMTELYMVSDIFELLKEKLIAVLPGKDNRFCQSDKTGELFACFRPTEDIAYPGSISFSRLTLDELTNSDVVEKIMEDSPLLKFSIKNVKFGPNAIKSYLSKTQELVRLVCHVAVADPYEKDGYIIENDFINSSIHYRAFVGKINPDNLNEEINLTEVARRDDFPLTEKDIKGKRYKDVVFPGDIYNGYLYAGAGDASIVRIPVKDF